MPWLNKIKRAQFAPILEEVVKAITITAIWDTEEKAIRTFISVACTQSPLIKTIDHLAILRIRVARGGLDSRIENTLISPNPPSFKRTAAKNIEPTTGAST